MSQEVEKASNRIDNLVFRAYIAIGFNGVGLIIGLTMMTVCYFIVITSRRNERDMKTVISYCPGDDDDEDETVKIIHV